MRSSVTEEEWRGAGIPSAVHYDIILMFLVVVDWSCLQVCVQCNW